LQCVAVCCSVLQCVTVLDSVLQCVAVCCSVLQCVAVCCSVLQCVAVCCSGKHITSTSNQSSRPCEVEQYPQQIRIFCLCAEAAAGGTKIIGIFCKKAL